MAKNTNSKTNKGNTTMPKTTKKTATATTETTPEATPVLKTGSNRVRVKLESKSIPGFWVRARIEVVEKHGYPLDPKGEPMVPAVGGGGRLSPEESAKRQAEKEAEKAKLAAMTPEEKAQYAKEKREERKQARLAKKDKERAELIAKLKEEIKAGNL